MHFHQIIHNYLLNYREKHNSKFNFIVRQQGNSNDKNYPGGKFAHGLVFQGTNDYCFVALSDKSGGANATKSVGIVITPTKDNSFTAKLEIVFRDETDDELLTFYRTLASKFKNIKWDPKETRAHSYIGEFPENAPTLLYNWLNEYFPIIRKTAIDSGIVKLIPNDDRFNSLQEKLKLKLKEAKQEVNSLIDMENTQKETVGNLVKEFKAYLKNYAALTIEIYSDNFEKYVSFYLKEKTTTFLTKEDIKELSEIKRYQFDRKTHYEHKGKGYSNFVSFFKEKINLPKHSIIPTNKILYGPPGTGKTYATKELAIKLISPNTLYTNSKEDRRLLVTHYNKLVANGQIVFTTFHQSMSYEDFVEGIKPKTQGNDVIYDVEDGIFKLLSDTAKDNWEAYHNNISDKKVAFDDVFNQLKEDWEENNEIQFPMKREGNDFTIIGFTNRSIQFKKASGGTGHTLSIDTLKKGFYNEKNIQSTGVGIYYPSIIDRLKTYEASKEESTELKSYVLIIDEINRGNVSAIFGELITLLEPDKRLGEKEEITVTLPYSKSESKFGIPPNLHIIGTMNTADRSVEALDTALRRRFEFKEIMPDYDVITDEFVEGIELDELLQTINERIELLIDRDHTIGHSYFINVDTPQKLANAFNNKIVPLMQEYFYGDYGKIGLVLGKGFIEKVKNDEINFADFEYENTNDFKTPSYILKQVNANNIIDAIATLYGMSKTVTT